MYQLKDIIIIMLCKSQFKKRYEAVNNEFFLFSLICFWDSIKIEAFQIVVYFKLTPMIECHKPK